MYCIQGLYDPATINLDYYNKFKSKFFKPLKEYALGEYQNYRYYVRAVIDHALPTIGGNYPICNNNIATQTIALTILNDLIDLIAKYDLDGSIPLATDIINHIVTVQRVNFGSNHPIFVKLKQIVKKYCAHTNVTKDPEYINKINPSICACLDLTPESYCNTTQCSSMSKNNIFIPGVVSTPTFFDPGYKPDCPPVCLKYVDIQPNNIQTNNIIQKCGDTTLNVVTNSKITPKIPSFWIFIFIILGIAIVIGIVTAMVLKRNLFKI